MYFYVFCSLTDIQTDKKNCILDAHKSEESSQKNNQTNILNSGREIYVSLSIKIYTYRRTAKRRFRQKTDRQANYREPLL